VVFKHQTGISNTHTSLDFILHKALNKNTVSIQGYKSSHENSIAFSL